MQEKLRPRIFHIAFFSPNNLVILKLKYSVHYPCKRREKSAHFIARPSSLCIFLFQIRKRISVWLKDAAAIRGVV